jgi:cobalt-zinc-cadmium efflux system membrane fusion protein
VFVRQADDLYLPRKVVLGSRAGNHTEVLKGLAEGEAVVTTGSFLLKTEILKSSIGAGCCEVETGR